jgi:hypothetical protein
LLPRNPANSNPHEFPRHFLTIIDDSYSAAEPIRGSGILIVIARGLPEAQSGQASPW